jgi:hypothetical protein
MRAALTGPGRRFAVREIFRRMPSRLRPGAAAADAVVRWDVTGGKAGPDTWYAVFADGGCHTTRTEPDTRPRVTLTVGAVDLVRLATGAENPMALFQGGRVSISGDLFFAAQLSTMFVVPASPR